VCVKNVLLLFSLVHVAFYYVCVVLSKMPVCCLYIVPALLCSITNLRASRVTKSRMPAQCNLLSEMVLLTRVSSFVGDDRCDFLKVEVHGIFQ